MQTAIRISQGKPGGTHYPLGRPVRHPKRNSGTKKEDTAATGKRHDFLTDKIPPLAPDFWHKDGYDGSPVNLTTPENFDYLYQSASNYAGLMGIKLPFRYRKGGSPPSENHRTVQGDGRERAGVCQSGRERRKAPFLSVPPSRLAGTRAVLDSHRLYGTASRTIEEHCQGVHPAIRPASRSLQCHRGVLL